MTGLASNTKSTAVWSAAFSAVAFLILSTGPAVAQNSWSLQLSEKEQMLNHTGDPMWMKSLMWDTAYERMIDRNMPYVEVTNASTSLTAINDFHLTIGDTRFNFAPVSGGNLAVLGSTSASSGITLTSQTCTTNCVADPGDELIVNFGPNGLAPGKTVRFKIKLGIDSNFAAAYAASFGASVPDYRTVLFDVNADGGSKPIDLYGPTVPDPEDNGNAFVHFGTTKSSVDVFEDTLIDAIGQPVEGQFRNNNLRHYTDMDPVNLFELNGAVIPEPSSIGLAMIGISGLFLRRRRFAARLAA